MIVGVLLVAMKLVDLGPVATWAWGWVAAPLGVALLWWWYADASGLNKRREMSRMEKRKAERRRNALENLGAGPEGVKEKRLAEKPARRASARSTSSRASAPPNARRPATRCSAAGSTANC